MEDVHESAEQDREANSQPAVKESRGVLSASPFTSAQPQTVDRFLSGSTGRFVVDNSGKSRYLENNLWVTLNEELRDPQQIVQEQGKDVAAGDSDEDDNNTDLETGRLLFETPKSDRELRRQYFHPEVIDILWDTYIRSVDPICKILHVPTFQKVIDLAKKNINQVPKNELALLFSVYHFAITSMTTDVFERTFTQPRKYLLAKFRRLTQQALINVGFLRSSDLTTLQAYLQYLVSDFSSPLICSCQSTIQEILTLFSSRSDSFSIPRQCGRSPASAFELRDDLVCIGMAKPTDYHHSKWKCAADSGSNC